MKFEELVQEYMPKYESIDELADFFALFADRTRMRIVTLLSLGEMCVGDVAYLLRISQSTVSHQLQKLKEKGIIDCRRSGKRMIYYLNNPKVEEMCYHAVLATEH